MRKLMIVAGAAAALTAGGAQSASAAEGFKGPCERQQELFETANIQMDMYIPYSREICAVTG